MSEIDQTPDVATLTVQLLSAYLANNTVASDDLADLIRSTRAALTENATGDEAPAEAETFTPAVSVRKSLASSGHIISLIDGKPYKTLKRHLASHGLTPETYRSRYNLPAHYPMVAPDYAAHRRAVAQKIGLGSRKPAAETQMTPEQTAPEQEAVEPTDASPAAPAAPSPEADKAQPKRAPRGGKATKEAAPPQAEASADAPAKETAKRRGKSNPSKAGEASVAPEPATETEAKAKPAPKSAAKTLGAKKPQRMARQAKSDATAQDDSADKDGDS